MGNVLGTNKVFTIMLLSVVTSFSMAASPGAGLQTIEEKVSALNNDSLSILGVSINAIRYLASANQSSFMPLWYLQQSGEIKHINELEKVGYVKVTKRVGLPDGTEKDIIFINITPIGKGIEIQQQLKSLNRSN